MRPVSSFSSASQGKGPNITTYGHRMLYLWCVMGAPSQDRSARYGRDTHHLKMERAAVLPGGQRQCAGGYSSHRVMSGYGGNTQIHIMLVAIAGHTADWNAGS
jgi:hypothetical protein